MTVGKGKLPRDPKKIKNHTAMVAIHSARHDFASIHKTLRTTPAMAAGLRSRLVA
jgi:hypothetical protein